jgi:hypothetical protein
VSLDDRPSYKALSYTWGNPNLTNSILIAGKTFWISAKLYDALQHLRVGEHLVIWIDAICINQKDDEEKAWQVEQMCACYEQAASVFVWLGPTTDKSDLAMTALKRMQEEIRQFWLSRGGIESSTEEDDEALGQLKVTKSLRHLFGEIPSEYQNGVLGRASTDIAFPMQAVARLLKRPCWGRVWVVQEFALAKEVVFVCGAMKMAGHGGLEVVTQTWDLYGHETGIYPYLLDHRPWSLLQFRQNRRKGQELSLKHLLQIGAKSKLEASNPRDIVFALFGLAKDRDELGISVSYSKTVCHIYIEVAKVYLLQKDLSILSYCSFLGGRNHDIPSWCPDWSLATGLIPLLEAGGGAVWPFASPFSALRETPASVRFGEDTTNPKTLSLLGIRVDTVSRDDATHCLSE